MNTLDFPAYLHAINPFAIQITDTFGVRWYGLSYLAGFICGYLAIRARALAGRSPLKAEQVSDFVFFIALGTILGGRLGYCLLYSPDLFLSFRATFPYWGVLAIHEGGMASHGGIVGVILACYFYAKKHKLPFAHLMDLTTLGGSIGICLGRIANFINGELVGRPVQSAVPWAVKFPQDILTWPGSAPEKLAELTPAVEQIGVPADRWQAVVGRVSIDGSAYNTVENILHQLVSAVQNGNALVSATLKPLLTPRHPSQIYQSLLEGLLIFTILMIAWRKPMKPGIITGLFLVIYAIMRIIGEQFRMPDPQIGFQLFGLTRGQWLSAAMLLPALAVLTYFSLRKDSRKF